VGESAVRSLVAVIRFEIDSGRPLVTVPQTHPAGEETEVDSLIMVNALDMAR
jgi:hypothetical protein